MKELKSLGRVLSKEKQKKIMGGVVPDTRVIGLVGWRLENGNCYCDFINYQTMQEALDLEGQVPSTLCNILCWPQMCSSASLDPCAYGC